MGKSIGQIVEKRRSGKTAILLTGATGFLGSHLAIELLTRKYHLYLLCRPKSGMSAGERILDLFSWFGLHNPGEFSFEVIEGTIDRPRFGLTLPDYTNLAGKVDEIFHCAAETSFTEKKLEMLERINILSLDYLLDFARDSSCSFFHHISTAYVAGKDARICPEEIVETRMFHNSYERTKHQGELHLLNRCRKLGIRVNIYRPSIVYGNSQNGKTFRFNALYYPIKTILYLKKIFLKDIKERGGKNAREMGIELLEEGSFFFPLRIIKTEGSVNIIPVDYFTRACITLFEEALEGDIYHIVSNKPANLDTVIDFFQRLFKFKGIKSVSPEEYKKIPENGLEKLFASYLKPYMPYFCDKRIFTNQKAEKILSKHAVACPDFVFSIFKICMDYALLTDWGKNCKKC